MLDIDELKDELHCLHAEKKELRARIDKATGHIEHELNEHILLNDEVTWNKEYYTKGKLDYRKLLIGLLQQTLDILKGSDSNE